MRFVSQKLDNLSSHRAQLNGFVPLVVVAYSSSSPWTTTLCPPQPLAPAHWVSVQAWAPESGTSCQTVAFDFDLSSQSI